MQSKSLSFSLKSITAKGCIELICLNSSTLFSPNHMPSESTAKNVLSRMGYKDVKVDISSGIEGCLVLATTSSESRHPTSYHFLLMMARCIGVLAIIPLAAKLIEATCPSPLCELINISINILPLAVPICGVLCLDSKKHGIQKTAILSSAPVYLLYTGTKASIFNNKAICAVAMGASMLMGYVFHKYENSDEIIVRAAIS